MLKNGEKNMSKIIEIVFLPAENGDCILIKLGDPVDTSILIDGGTAATYPLLHKELSGLYEKCPKNYIFLTHCDDDHIGGLIEFFKFDASLFKYITTVFYNYPRDLKKNHPNVAGNIQEPQISKNTSGNLSPDQLKKFTELLEESGVEVVSSVYYDYVFPEDNNFKITILSPRKKALDSFDEWIEPELGLLSRTSDWNVPISKLATYRDKNDTSHTNASSISFILEYNDKNYLFLADAIASDIVESLIDIGNNKDNMINASLVKVSHHGSKYNTSNSLLDLIYSKRFVILTSGKTHNHPDKESLAKIIHHCPNARLLFNYELDFNNLFSEQNHEEYPHFSYQVTRSITE